MLSNAVLLALSAAAQAVYTAAGSGVICFHFHVPPTYKPGVPFITFTELDEHEQLLGGGPTGLRGSNYGAPDIVLARYRLNGAQIDAGSSTALATAQALTEQMRADKTIFPTIFSLQANTNLGGLVVEAGQKLHIASPRGGPYDLDQPVRVQLAWECTIAVRSNPRGAAG